MAYERELERLRDELQGRFAELWQGARVTRRRRGFAPAADVFRTANPPVVTVVVDLAGVDPTDMRVSCVDGVLTVRGVRRPVAGEAGGTRYEQIEIDYGPFERRIPVGVDVDVERIQAVYRRGLLTVTLPVASRPVESFNVVIAIRGLE